MDMTLGEEKPITTWRAALTHVSELAHARLPEALHGHLERATALCVHRHVWFDDDGKHAQVLSSDGETWYLVNGNCTCMDAPKAPNGYCKHKLATMIYRRASELLAPAARPTPPAAWPLAPFRALRAEAGVGDGRPATPALPEAPASANARVMIDGHEVQVTLRDTDEERLLVRLATLLARYPAAACGGAGGAATVGAAQPTPEGWCLVHHAQMTRQSNERGSWWSHRSPDGGWCRGKAPRA